MIPASLAGYDDSHRLPHEPGEETLWNESSLLYWVDLRQGLVGFHRFGYQPNRGLANYQCCVTTPDAVRYRRATRRLALRGDERRSDGYGFDDFLSVSYTPGASRWIARDGDCELDLRMSEYTPLIHMQKVCGPVKDELTRSEAADHYDVAGQIAGNVRVGDRTYPIDCLGFVDRSWGVRTWALSSHRWCSGTFGPDFTFAIVSAIGRSPHQIQAGYILKDGRADRVTGADITVFAAEDGVTHRGGRVTFETERHAVFDFHVDTLDCALLEADDWLAAEGLSSVSHDGRIGVCDLEWSNNPRNGATAPPLVLDAAVVNGLSRRTARRVPGAR